MSLHILIITSIQQLSLREQENALGGQFLVRFLYLLLDFVIDFLHLVQRRHYVSKLGQVLVNFAFWVALGNDDNTVCVPG